VDSRKLTLSVVPDQGRQKGLRDQKGIYANQSRDVDSRNLILAVVLDQGLAKKDTGG
jgi:hypothetical protein